MSVCYCRSSEHENLRKRESRHVIDCFFKRNPCTPGTYNIYGAANTTALRYVLVSFRGNIFFRQNIIRNIQPFVQQLSGDYKMCISVYLIATCFTHEEKLPSACRRFMVYVQLSPLYITQFVSANLRLSEVRTKYLQKCASY